MRRFYLAILAVALTTFGIYLAGCGGGSHKAGLTQPTSNCLKLATLHARRHCEGWATHGVPQPPSAQLPLAAERTVDMQDTTDYASTIVGQPFAVAGYLDGLYQSYPRLRASGRWPGNRTVSITVFGHSRAECGDFEPGDMGPGQAASFFFFERSQGVAKPCLYSSTSNMYSVQGNLEANGIGRGRWWKWCAHYRYYGGLEGDCDALQYSDHGPHGENVDLNTVKISFFGPPPPPPGPSKATLGKWRRGKLDARRQWDRNKCGDHALRPSCPHYRRLVVAYQLLFQQKGHYPPVKCWGGHAKKGEAVCDVLRPSVPAWANAAASSRKQYWTRGCQHHPRRHDCVVFAQRTAWFNARWKSAQQQF